MRTAIVLLVVAITSLAALAILARGGVARLGAALGLVLEVIGATVVFLVANVMVGFVLVLAGRSLSLFYTTLYDVTDLGLPILSLVQALMITAWRMRAS